MITFHLDANVNRESVSKKKRNDAFRNIASNIFWDLNRFFWMFHILDIFLIFIKHF